MRRPDRNENRQTRRQRLMGAPPGDGWVEIPEMALPPTPEWTPGELTFSRPPRRSVFDAATIRQIAEDAVLVATYSHSLFHAGPQSHCTTHGCCPQMSALIDHIARAHGPRPVVTDSLGFTPSRSYLV